MAPASWWPRTISFWKTSVRYAAPLRWAADGPGAGSRVLSGHERVTGVIPVGTMRLISASIDDSDLVRALSDLGWDAARHDDPRTGSIVHQLR